ncbi:MAG: hypothetical protein H7346_26335 [Burkholderiaceae bacterium]|nr:hypothetical protein [Burkholderiaceae bacterium]
MPRTSFMMREGTLFQQHRTGTALVISVLCALILAVPASATGARTRARPVLDTDLASNFGMLAQQRPWRCVEQEADDVPRTGWTGGTAECAWQNHLRMRQWSGPASLAKDGCVSAQARWWAWLRGAAAPAGTPASWRSTWTAQRLVEQGAAQQRIAIIQRLPDGRWRVTEWRWQPSARAATRRWQQGRWNLLVLRASQLAGAVDAPQGPVEARMLRSTLEQHIGNRVAEIGTQSWQWETDGLCLGVDALGLGQQIMQLPYNADDSRMEQRAAMQLQLARRYPKATWLTDFSLVPFSAHARGGAKFYAIWIEQAILKGQLWIPTKGNGPLVRVRITTAPAAAPARGPDPQAIARAEQVVQRELAGLASRWANAHE